MDPGVLAAMKRWPNVPAVYDWLSLTPRGEWRLHPLGDAGQGGPGESISNEQILAFINRNYVGGLDGCWFFQNGPQRVFVRIDGAPLILRVDPIAGQLTAHCGQLIQQVRHWWVDELGRLFVQTDAGPGMVDDRDLIQLCEVLRSADGQSLVDLFENLPSNPGQPAAAPASTIPADDQTRTVHSSAEDKHVSRLVSSGLFDPTGSYAALIQPAPLSQLDASRIPACLGFVTHPGPQTTHETTQALE